MNEKGEFKTENVLTCYGIILLVFLFFILALLKVNDEQNKIIEKLQTENEDIKIEQQFMTDTYNEQIVMLDSYCTMLEAEIIELQEEVNSVKK